MQEDFVHFFVTRNIGFRYLEMTLKGKDPQAVLGALFSLKFSF